MPPDAISSRGTVRRGDRPGGQRLNYLPRVVENELTELLNGVPAIALEGPRAAGKTETSLRLASRVFRLDDPDQLQLAAADPARLVAQDQLTLIDEWQKLPEIWDRVRRAVDENPSPGRFLLTGSAAPPETPTHSGAGRIVTVRMRPMALSERAIETPTVSLADLLSGGRPRLAGETDLKLTDYAEEILRSGYPGIRILPSERAIRSQLDGYIEHTIEHDLPEVGYSTRDKGALRLWMEALAAATSTTTSDAKLRDAVTARRSRSFSPSTMATQRRTLEQLWIIEELPAWLPSRNQLQQVGSAPVHNLADPALAARLAGATIDSLLDGVDSSVALPRDGTFLGALFESLVTQSLRTYAQHSEAAVFHLRTHRGNHEVDNIVRRGDGKVVAIEVKLKRTPDDRDTRHLQWLQERIGGDLLDAIIITTGPSAYRRTDGIGVVPAALLGP